MALIRIDGQVGWRIARDPYSDRWVGVCDALALTAEAETSNQLTEICYEILEDLFCRLLEEGSLDRFLKSHGWHPLVPLPERIPEDGVTFDIPISMSMDRPPVYAQA
jgi:hypothetical protein